MKGKVTVLLAALASGVSVAVVPVPAAASAAIPYLWRNCTHVHAKYPHGVGRVGAHDGTSGVPVTTFNRSTRLYNVAMRYNKRLDADRDGIACEKR